MSWFPGPSVSHGARRSEVREELEAEADHKVPDVSGHLGAGDEHPPDQHHQDSVEGVADVPQPVESEHGDTGDKDLNQPDGQALRNPYLFNL